MFDFSKPYSLALFVLIVIHASLTVAVNAETASATRQVWQFVDDHFYDRDFNGVKWESIMGRYTAASTNSHEQETESINRMLAELHSSHTFYYTSDTPAFYQLLGLFLPNNPGLRAEYEAISPGSTTTYTGIGIFTELIDRKTFVSGVLHGGPAYKSGILVGDEIVTVNDRPFHPIRSFLGTAEETAMIGIRRHKRSKKELVLETTPKVLDGKSMFLHALRNSAEIIVENDYKIGYLRVWSYAGQKYQDAIRQLLIYGPLRDADALVLDLRGGWGGANARYLNFFRKRSITIEGRGGEGFSYRDQSAWSKPVVLLMNNESRSGKEIFAYGFKKLGIGKVVGERTAGHVLGGAPFFTDAGGVLYLAVSDTIIDEKVRLEGVGVEPDITVPFQLAYANGYDPQKERAISEAAKDASRTSSASQKRSKGKR